MYISDIPRFYVDSVAEQTGLSPAWSHIPKLRQVFLWHGSIYVSFILWPTYYSMSHLLLYYMSHLLLYVPFTTLCPIYYSMSYLLTAAWRRHGLGCDKTTCIFYCDGFLCQWFTCANRWTTLSRHMYVQKCSIYIEIFIFIAIHFHVFPVQDHFGSMTFDDCQERKKYFLNACSVAWKNSASFPLFFYLSTDTSRRLHSLGQAQNITNVNDKSCDLDPIWFIFPITQRKRILHICIKSFF